MGRHDDAPQTVGDALSNGWNWLGVECGYCRGRPGRVDLQRRRRDELLATIAARLRCKTCPPDVSGRDHLHFKLIAVWTNEQEKRIGFSGKVAMKITMT